jgi:hypothetical protein
VLGIPSGLLGGPDCQNATTLSYSGLLVHIGAVRLSPTNSALSKLGVLRIYLSRFIIPPSYEPPAPYQASFSRVGIFGGLRRFWVVEVVGILKSGSVVFNFCPRRCVVDTYFFNVELQRSAWVVIAVLGFRKYYGIKNAEATACFQITIRQIASSVKPET